MEKRSEKYLGGRLDNSGSDWMFWSGTGDVVEYRRESKASRAPVIGQIVMSKGNTKVKTGFRNRSSVWF